MKTGNPAFAMAAILICSTLFLRSQISRPSTNPIEVPRSWVDPDTGHRVVRLTSEPGSASLYFHQNGYTAAG